MVVSEEPCHVKVIEVPFTTASLLGENKVGAEGREGVSSTDDETEYVWGVYSGNAAGWCDKSEVLANARIFTNGQAQ